VSETHKAAKEALRTAYVKALRRPDGKRGPPDNSGNQGYRIKPKVLVRK